MNKQAVYSWIKEVVYSWINKLFIHEQNRLLFMNKQVSLPSWEVLDSCSRMPALVVVDGCACARSHFELMTAWTSQDDERPRGLKTQHPAFEIAINTMAQKYEKHEKTYGTYDKCETCETCEKYETYENKWNILTNMKIEKHIKLWPKRRPVKKTTKIWKMKTRKIKTKHCGALASENRNLFDGFPKDSKWWKIGKLKTSKIENI